MQLFGAYILELILSLGLSQKDYTVATLTPQGIAEIKQKHKILGGSMQLIFDRQLRVTTSSPLVSKSLMENNSRLQGCHFP